MECVVCNAAASGVQVIFSLILWLVTLFINLIVAIIDWSLTKLLKSKK